MTFTNAVQGAGAPATEHNELVTFCRRLADAGLAGQVLSKTASGQGSTTVGWINNTASGAVSRLQDLDTGVTGAELNALKAKVDGIELNAKNDQLPAEIFSDIFQVGLDANKPAAAAYPGFYFSTDIDGGSLYYSNGTNYTKIAASVNVTGGGGAAKDRLTVAHVASGAVNIDCTVYDRATINASANVTGITLSNADEPVDVWVYNSGATNITVDLSGLLVEQGSTAPGVETLAPNAAMQIVYTSYDWANSVYGRVINWQAGNPPASTAVSSKQSVNGVYEATSQIIPSLPSQAQVGDLVTVILATEGTNAAVGVLPATLSAGWSQAGRVPGASEWYPGILVATRVLNGSVDDALTVDLGNTSQGAYISTVWNNAASISAITSDAVLGQSLNTQGVTINDVDNAHVVAVAQRNINIPVTGGAEFTKVDSRTNSYNGITLFVMNPGVVGPTDDKVFTTANNVNLSSVNFEVAV